VPNVWFVRDLGAKSSARMLDVLLYYCIICRLAFSFPSHSLNPSIVGCDTKQGTTTSTPYPLSPLNLLYSSTTTFPTMGSFLSMSVSSSAIDSSAWLHFLAGALVPTVAWFFLRRPASVTGATVDNMEDDDEFDDDDDDEDGSPETNISSSPKDWGPQDAPYKMVLCINLELGMGKGKMAAQCGHATLGAYKRAMKRCPNAVKWWERMGCAKIAVKCPTELEMHSVFELAVAKDIPLYMVEDAGRTQIAAGSRTVLGLGPAPTHVFEGVTSHLKLM
jgi:PTH2 family peptidyl-tRNA hydrolase